MFPVDIINEISKFSSNRSIAFLLQANKTLWSVRGQVYFNEMYLLTLRDVGYYVSRLKNVSIESWEELSGGKLPISVTHLTFGHYFDQSIEKGIPNSVTHLTFGWRFNQSIEKGIPNSVTHLTFENNFNQSIEKGIPNSVTHLTFGDHFNQSEKVYPTR